MYVLGGDEPALVDCGPSSCLGALEDVSEDPGSRSTTSVTSCSPTSTSIMSAPPERWQAAIRRFRSTLTRSGRRTSSIRAVSSGAPGGCHGQDFDRLWGELAPVPEANLRPVGARVLDLGAFPIPGRALHDVSFLAPDGACFAGDAAGVRIEPCPFVLPASPPPDADLEAWAASLNAIEEGRPTRLFLTPFGLVADPQEHVPLMRERLRTRAERVREGATAEAFERAAEAELQAGEDAETADSYEQAAPFWQSHAGLERYWRKRREEEAA
jgi:glyoxylase-like metal-dependent hydrolase (beta-lactamase superfamily II)